MYQLFKFIPALFKVGFMLLFLLHLTSPLAAHNRAKDAFDGQPLGDEESDIRSIRKSPIHVQLPKSLSNGSDRESGQAVTVFPGSIVTIMNEDFEGDFPGGLWTVLEGDYTWAKRNCAAHNGQYSAWAAGGGNLGLTQRCNANYPDNASTMMIYGPFDLSDVNWAALSFHLWLNTVEADDYIGFLASEDGVNFYGLKLYGSTNDEWWSYSLALTAVPVEGEYQNFTGKSTVWIAFQFESNGSENASNGVFIDDVVLQKGLVNVPTVVTYFAAPGPSPRGLAFDGTNLWCSDATNDRIYKLSPSGSVISSFASPNSIPVGLAWDGANLWNADNNSDRIYKLSLTGSVLSSFAAPGGGGSGLVWDGLALWHCDFRADQIWKLNTNGAKLDSIPAPGTYTYGLAWDGENFWVADGYTLLIYKIDPSGNVLDYFLTPGTYATGLAWDGTHLWATDRDTDLIYKLQLKPFENDIGTLELEVPDQVALNSPVAIKMLIRNFGTSAQSNFKVSYQIDTEIPVTENYTASLAPNSEASYTFATNWTPINVGKHTIKAWTALVGDENPSNDSLSTPKTVLVLPDNDVQTEKFDLPDQFTLGKSTLIKVIIKNNGSKPQSNFEIGYQINDEPPIIEWFSDVLSPGTSVNTSFAKSWRPTKLGLVKLTAWTVLADDSKPANDTLSTRKVVNIGNILNPPQQLIAATTGDTVILNWKAPIPVTLCAYAGEWSGKNSQNNAINFRVTDYGIIDTLCTRLKMNFITFTVTANFINKLTAVEADSFKAVATLPPVVSNIYTTVHGTFGSTNSASGTSSGYTGSYFIYTGDRFAFGTGSPLKAGTWQATNNKPSQTTLPELTQYRIYRSPEPNAAETGTLIGTTEVSQTSFNDIGLDWGTYYYQITAVYREESEPSEEVQVNLLPSGIAAAPSNLPMRYALEQNFPNPFNPTTTISYALPRPATVELKVYDILGNEVQTLVEGHQAAGFYRLQFDCSQLACGLYFYRLTAGEFKEQKKMVIVK